MATMTTVTLIGPVEASQMLGVPANTLRYRASKFLETAEGRATSLNKFGTCWLAPLSVWEYLATTDWRTRGQRIRRGRQFPDAANQ